MIRTFSLVVFDEVFNISDRIRLDAVTSPQNLGFEISLNTIRTDIEEIVTKAVQSLKEISLTVNFYRGGEYQKAAALRRWIEGHMLDSMALEYRNDAELKYADCIITKYGMTEIGQNRIMTVPLTVRPLSPFYQLRNNVITIRQDTPGKAYPYSYPYNYGGGLIESNIIENSYIKDIPLVVKIYGVTDTPTLTLIEDGAEAPYSTVQFLNAAIGEGQYLVVDSIRRKIRFWNGSAFEDYYGRLNMSADRDSFLYARQNTVSKLTINLLTGASGYLEASFKQYEL